MPLQVQAPNAWQFPVNSQSSPSPGSVSFNFMLRRAAGVEWGLDVARDGSGQALLVQGVLPGGAIDSWNKQVMGGPKADSLRALLVGDLIVSVNNKRDCQAMVDESKNSMLLKMEVLRQQSP